MNALTEMPPMPPRHAVASRGGLRSAPGRGGYALGLLIALGIHAVILFAWPKAKGPDHQVEFDVDAGDASVEVTLVSAPPAEDIAPPVEQPPLPEPPPEPTPEPPPPPEKAPEMTLPEPPPKPPEVEQKREPLPKARPPRAEPKPHPVTPARHAVGDGSSKIPGNDATTARAASGALSAKPAYLRNPHPSYPEEARAAKQQGLVSLRVSVNASGHVVSVRFTQSSGFAILDERARSTVAESWVFKPAMSNGMAVPSEVVIPIRFTLDH
jgi:periplasmic protein TonB